MRKKMSAVKSAILGVALGATIAGAMDLQEVDMNNDVPKKDVVVGIIKERKDAPSDTTTFYSPTKANEISRKIVEIEALVNEKLPPQQQEIFYAAVPTSSGPRERYHSMLKWFKNMGYAGIDLGHTTIDIQHELNKFRLGMQEMAGGHPEFGK